MTFTVHAYRGQILFFDPILSTIQQPKPIWHEDGLLIVADGRIQHVGDYETLYPSLPPHVLVHDYRGKIISPGFIDTHIHYPQTDMIASPAPDLLPWLETYTFPTESNFHDPQHADQVSRFFLNELLRNGTTTALVYGSVHKSSVESFFTQSAQRNMRMVAGKVLMDRNCPEYLQDTAITGAQDSADLIERWHHKGRQLYALTPRFAPTSSPGQLQSCQALANAYPDIFIQTHVAESQAEIAWVHELFPSYRSYLDIYDHYDLVRPRAVYGHGIYLDQQDWQRIAQSGASISHCPTSNLFLGSGLFDSHQALHHQASFSLGTDVGAGTSFSLLKTMAAAYQIARLKNHYLNAFQLFYLATAGAAQQLQLEMVGSFSIGNEADFIIIDDTATPLLSRRQNGAASLEERLFSLITLGDDRCIQATYIAGQCQHLRS